MESGYKFPDVAFSVAALQEIPDQYLIITIYFLLLTLFIFIIFIFNCIILLLLFTLIFCRFKEIRRLKLL
jgi:hypothetical protein